MKDSNWKIPDNMEDFELPKFPIHCLPTKISKYVLAVAEELQVPIDMVATSVLAAISLCNQGKYMIEGKIGWREPLNLYAINIAKPSERKSPTMAKIIGPILEYEKEENKIREIEVMNSESSMELYTNQLKKLKNKYGNNPAKDQNIKYQIEELNEKIRNFEKVNFLTLIVDDITPEALISVMKENGEKVGIFSSEGGIFDILAGKYSNNISNFDVILKSYSGDLTKVNRKGREEEKLYKPYLTILLFVQPLVIQKLFNNTDFLGKGLCSRFLYCYPKSKVGERNIDSSATPIEIEEDYNNIIRKLLKNEQKEPIILKLSLEAYKVSQEFARDLEHKFKGELEEVEEWAGKLHGNILRIAGNIHLIKEFNNTTSISDETMLQAIEIGMFYLEHSKKIYRIIGIDEEHIKAKRIITKFKEKKISGTIKKNEIYRISRGKGIKEVKDIEKPLEILIEEGYVKIKEIENENKHGRPPDKIVELNPHIFK